MQRHHLKTRRKDRNAVELICRECHKTIHGLFDLSELRDERRGLDTLEGLMSDERFARAVGHIRKLEPGAHMRMARPRDRRRR